MRIGILTQYYQSINYGGVLQAYALCRFLNSNGYQGEQICYQLGENKSFRVMLKKAIQYFPVKLLNKICHKIRLRIEKIVFRRQHQFYIKKQAEQREKFVHFREELTPNNQVEVTDATIHTIANDYDCFITGSDQVWNFQWFRPSFFLGFVPAGKKKLAYAASIAMPSLSEQRKDYFRESLRDFDAVSVREKSAVDLLDGLSPVPVEAVADPTLLLSREEWDTVCADRVIDGAYIFCYFLGSNPRSRQICKQFADARGLKIVNLPMANNGARYIDTDFGDITVTPSPEEFISLIKYASYIFTDSFHCVVFSHIYGKQYFVFKRDENDTMSSRITDITALFGTEERYCVESERETQAHVESLPDIVYGDHPALDALIDRSKAFLLGHLEE